MAYCLRDGAHYTLHAGGGPGGFTLEGTLAELAAALPAAVPDARRRAALEAVLDAYRFPPTAWVVGGRPLPLNRPVLMGILNVTPDSFADGGRFLDPARAIEHGLQMAAEGADLLDIGGESTRPGAAPVEVSEELARVLPVIRELKARCPLPLSIDTTKAAVAREALRAGACVVNDISALEADPAMAAEAAAHGASVVLMHRKGTPDVMQKDPRYDDLPEEVLAGLAAGLTRARAAGIPDDRIAVDPGIGFGKTLDHNLWLLRHIEFLQALGRPILVGASRKSFIGAYTGRPVDDRLPGTLAAHASAWRKGARIFRVHDVGAHRDFFRLEETLDA
jgi:dihydropteroate synthase